MPKQERKRTALGLGLEESLQEILEWKRGERTLEVRKSDPMPPECVRAIQKAVSKSVKDFEQRFHIPAGTLNNWLQGRRKPDPASRAYLTVISRNPKAVEQALNQGEATAN